MAAAAILSLFCGKYPLTLAKLLSGDAYQLRVFWTLRFSRTLMAVFGGFCLGVVGFVYQAVFRNPLASPDIIGVASGASAGAAAGLLFFSGTAAVVLCSFTGALIAVLLALGLAALDRTGRSSAIVLAGIAVHALAQTALMCLKLTADPERQLASIEYWIMGSLSGIYLKAIIAHLILGAVCLCVLFLLYRPLLLLSADADEAQMLGVPVMTTRLIVLLIATLAVSSVISLTGLISFVGLLAPHAARLLTKNQRPATLWLSGLIGGILLCIADILARTVTGGELPVSIFTSLLGAPFLLYLLFQRGRQT